jgi:class 3 adenylate cyclase
MPAGLQTFLFTDLVGFTALTAERGDDADAVHVGLDLVDGLAAVAGFPAVRVGMHTGLAVHRAGDWYGTTVTLASRLCTTALAAAPLREVRLGEPRLHWLRNVVEPVTAHSASAAPSLTTRLTARLPCMRGRMTLPTPPNLPEALA